MSRQELAEAVNAYLWTTFRERASLDRSYVGKLETGKHRWPRARYREAFRTVLGAGTDAEIGFYVTRGLRTSSVSPTAGASDAIMECADEEEEVNRRDLLRTAVPGVAGLISVMAASPDDVRLTVSQGMDDLVAQVTVIRHAYQHSRYAAATRSLPAVLLRLHREPAVGTETQRRSALTAEAYQVASALLLKAEEPVLAAIAADRSVRAARATGDELAVASSVRAVVHGLMAGGHADQAATVAANAAARLAERADMNSTAALSVYGALLLRGAIAAARSDNPGRAGGLLDEAARAAKHLGVDGNVYWTAFGPTNVAAHRVAVAVELGDAGTAVRLASAVDLSGLVLPERKAMLLLDTARALTQWGKWERALDAIRRAEDFAPEEVRGRRAMHMLDELARRSPAPVQRRVREYATVVRAAR